MMLMMASCNPFGDDDGLCGLDLRIRYDYNMEYADAFSTQVPSVDVFVFDADGVFLLRKHADGAELQTPDYRMQLYPELGAGKYKVMALAGLCDDYEILPMRRGLSTLYDLEVALKPGPVPGTYSGPMGHLWFGEAVDVAFSGSGWQTAPVNLIKNTNDFRVVARNLVPEDPGTTTTAATPRAGTGVDPDDFELCITCDDGDYDCGNRPLGTGQTDYRAHHEAALTPTDYVGEVRTMRLLENVPTRLVLRNVAEGKRMLDIDLMYYLRLMKSETVSSAMPMQEFLDRQSNYSLIFGGKYGNEGYIAISLTINGWTVWFQNTDL